MQIFGEGKITLAKIPATQVTFNSKRAINGQNSNYSLLFLEPNSNFMKTTKITLFIAVIFFAASCKKDEVKPTSSLDNVSLSLASQGEVITPPTGLSNSTDSHAEMAAGWIESINQMTSYTDYMKPPAGTAKSSTKITAKNGRVATAGDSETWIWDDGQGNSVGYQVSETTDSYQFDVFVKLAGTSDWLKYFHAEEKKDKSSGTMYILDFDGSDPTAKALQYDWTLSGTLFTFKMTSETDNSFIINVTYHTDTKAGQVQYIVNSKLYYDMIWDTHGAGSWTLYGEDGVTVEAHDTWAAG